jgi:hypothetical protein
MREKTCDICGHVVNPEDAVIHRIIPEEIAVQAGILDFRTTILCFNCSREVSDWYEKKVFNLKYDEVAKKFVYKSPTDLVNEYETIYKSFADYKCSRKSKKSL